MTKQHFDAIANAIRVEVIRALHVPPPTVAMGLRATMSRQCRAGLRAPGGGGRGPSAEAEGITGGWFYWYCRPGCMSDSDPVGAVC